MATHTRAWISGLALAALTVAGCTCSSSPSPSAPAEGLSPGPDASAPPEQQPDAGHALSGQVVAAGRPVPDATITLLPATGTAPLQFATTAADGSFRLSGLGSGAHTLEVIAPGLLPLWSQHVGVPADGPLTLALDPGRALHGIVIGPDQQPLAGAVVRAIKATRAPRAVGYRGSLGVVPGPVPPIPPRGTAVFRRATPAPPLWQTTTDAHGRFSLSGLPQHRIELLAEHPDDTTAARTYVDLTSEQPPAAVTITLKPGAVISGRIKNAEGEPLAGVRISATAAQRQHQVSTDDQGAFIVSGIRGTCHLRITHPRYRPADRTLALAPGERRTLTLTLSPRGPQISGAVVDDIGLPITGATVVLEDATRRALRRTQTNRRGQFRLDATTPRSGQLTVRHAHYAQRSWPVDERLPGEFVLARLSQVAGAVRLKRTGAPLATFTLRVAGEPGALGHPGGKTIRAPDGRFVVSMRPGIQTLEITAPGHARERIEVLVPEPSERVDAAEIIAELVAAGQVSGRILEASGAPVPGASVRCAAQTTTTAADGSFTLKDIPEGTHALHVRTHDRRELRSDLMTVRGGETTGPLTFTFPP